MLYCVRDVFQSIIMSYGLGRRGDAYGGAGWAADSAMVRTYCITHTHARHFFGGFLASVFFGIFFPFFFLFVFRFFFFTFLFYEYVLFFCYVGLLISRQRLLKKWLFLLVVVS